MPPPAVVTLFDVDNTLLDNDRIVADIRRHLVRTVGDEQQRRYWELFEQLREELGYADYLGAPQRFRMEDPHRPHLIQVSTFLLNYPFRLTEGRRAGRRDERWPVGAEGEYSDLREPREPHQRCDSPPRTTAGTAGAAGCGPHRCTPHLPEHGPGRTIILAITAPKGPGRQ